VTAVVGEAAGGDRQRRWWLAVAAAALVFFFSLSPLFFVLFFLSVFSAFPLLLSLFYSPLLLTCFPSLFFHLFCPPCFYRKKQGRDMAGAATVPSPLHRPSNTWKVFFWASGVGRRLFEREMVVENRERKIFFFPCFACTGEEENPPCRSKLHKY